MTPRRDAHGGDRANGPRGVTASRAAGPAPGVGRGVVVPRTEVSGAGSGSVARSVPGRGSGSVPVHGVGSVSGRGIGPVTGSGTGPVAVAEPSTGPVAESGTGPVAEYGARQVFGPGVETGTGPGVRPSGDRWAEVPLRITEFTDAACPWAWGAEPTFRLLRQTFGASVSWRRVFGILFDEGDDPAPDPDAEARWYEGFIRQVTVHTRAPYARRLHRLTRTSLPASRAARAASAQGEEVASRVLRRLRETTFVLGAPADTAEGVREAVGGVPGLDVARLAREMAGPTVDAAVRADHAEARRPHPQVWDLTEPGPHPGGAKELADGHRYALPTLLFEGPGGTVCVPGHRLLGAYLAAAGDAARLPVPDPVRLSPAVALERWRTLTDPNSPRSPATVNRRQAP